MAFNIYDASAPVFIASLSNMAMWLDKAEPPEAALIEARLAPDMKPLTAQFQFASDAAKGAIARLAGISPPSMADTEASIADLKVRVRNTIAFIESVPAADIAAGATRAIALKFPNGMGYDFTGAAFLTGFALPNFFFHVTTAYAILRAAGVPLGKTDFLQHLGQPRTM